MKKPTTNNQEVLFVAIKNGNVSLKDFPYLSGFRTRVSNLKLIYGIEFKEELISQINKFGRKINIVNHILVDIEKAKSCYNKMTRL